MRLHRRGSQRARRRRAWHGLTGYGISPRLPPGRCAERVEQQADEDHHHERYHLGQRVLEPLALESFRQRVVRMRRADARVDDRDRGERAPGRGGDPGAQDGEGNVPFGVNQFLGRGAGQLEAFEVENQDGRGRQEDEPGRLERPGSEAVQAVLASVDKHGERKESNEEYGDGRARMRAVPCTCAVGWRVKVRVP